MWYECSNLVSILFHDHIPTLLYIFMKGFLLLVYNSDACPGVLEEHTHTLSCMKSLHFLQVIRGNSIVLIEALERIV